MEFFNMKCYKEAVIHYMVFKIKYRVWINRERKDETQC